MAYNQALTERLAIVSTLDPVSQSAATVTSDVVDMKQFRRVIFILSLGAMTTNSTVDMTIKGDTASNGSFATTITGKAITQLTEAGSDGNKQVAVEVTAEEVAAQGYRYIRAAVVVGTAASLISLVGLGEFMRYSNASASDLSSVDELVV